MKDIKAQKKDKYLHHTKKAVGPSVNVTPLVQHHVAQETWWVPQSAGTMWHRRHGG
jgi:hypothetical protein